MMNNKETYRAKQRKWDSKKVFCMLDQPNAKPSKILVADTVVHSDGSHTEGQVVSVTEDQVLLRTAGETLAIPRAEVASIHFERPRPPLKVEIRNIRSDDAVDVLLAGEIVMSRAREKGAWIDLTPKLKDGNNSLRLRIHNARGGWAYHLDLRINGVVTKLSCGKPYDRNNPCECCGKSGDEIGVVDDLPLIWVHVDREQGHAEILR